MTPAAAPESAPEHDPPPSSDPPTTPPPPTSKSPSVSVPVDQPATFTAPNPDPTLMPAPTETEQPPTAIPQPDPSPPEQLAATDAPSAPPQSAALSTPPAARRAPARRNARNSRLGRPPNINENSLMRRLECVMAVDSGRMSMLTACQQYDISARTFYRWLRNKDRLIELTGFTEEDFRNNPPWGTEPTPPASAPAEGAQQQPRPDQSDEIDLPRLPPQTAQGKPSTPGASGMGMKRRFPKSDARVAFQPGEDRVASSAQQAALFARRSFTKMPSQTVPPGDINAERAAARASTRMRRDWPTEAARQAREGEFPETGSPNSPADVKRRKIVREEDAELPMETEEADVGGEFANGGAQFVRGQENSPTVGQVNGAREEDEVGKHRIEIMMGRRKVAIAWYEGASAEDIKTSIARRFALLPGTQWALIDKNFDEIVISAGVPSGRYTLTVFS